MTIQANNLQELRDKLNHLAKTQDPALFVPWQMPLNVEYPDFDDKLNTACRDVPATLELQIEENRIVMRTSI